MGEMWVRPSSYESRKVKGVNESDEEKYLRKARRHQKFGKLAELLSEEFKQPLEHVEVILEGIDDELNSKQRYISDVEPYLTKTDLEPNAPQLNGLTMEEQLKYKIARTFMVQLGDTLLTEKGTAKILEKKK